MSSCMTLYPKLKNENLLSQETATSVDGRVARTARTRDTILGATRTLILDGAMDPTAREVADRAGITTRTLFRHFPDMESLHRSLIDDAEAGAAQVMDEPFYRESDGEWRIVWDAPVSELPASRAT